LRDQPANAWLLRLEGHIVSSGETLTTVAQLYGTTRSTLRKLNPTYADYREWPGDAPLPLGVVLNLFAIRPSSPLPAGEALVVP
ncbi:MAG: LysM peptidoglycan-binding domain-containing protein, partial [Cyanobium sp.]